MYKIVITTQSGKKIVQQITEGDVLCSSFYIEVQNNNTTEVYLINKSKEDIRVFKKHQTTDSGRITFVELPQPYEAEFVPDDLNNYKNSSSYCDTIINDIKSGLLDYHLTRIKREAESRYYKLNKGKL